MFDTGLTEQEKESLIKYLCTRGHLTIKDGQAVFELDGPIYVDDKFTPGPLLKKAFNNITSQSIIGVGVKL